MADNSDQNAPDATNHPADKPPHDGPELIPVEKPTERLSPIPKSRARVRPSPKSDESGEALQLFKDEKSSAHEKDLGLEKADLTQIGSGGTGLRGRHKKNAQQDDTQALKKSIIQAAQSLLTLAGTSIEDLSATPKDKKKGGQSAQSQALESASNNSYISKDLAIVTHQELEHFEVTKLNTGTSKDGFTPKDKSKEVQDPFEETSSTGSIGSAEALSTEDFMPYRSQAVIVKKSFLHYFGIAAIVGLSLGLIIFGIIFITTLLNDDKPTYTELKQELEQSEEKELYTVDTTTQKITPIDANHPAIAEAKLVAENYLSADNKRIAYTFIIQKKSISKSFNKYWVPVKDFNPELLTFRRGFILPTNALWMSFSYGEGENERNVVLIQAEDKPFRLDWQAFSEIEKVPLADLTKEIKTTPFVIRTWIKPEHYYNVQYPDEHWQNYLAHDMEGNKLNCYVPLSTESAQKLYKKIISEPANYPKAGGKGAYVVLMVRKPKIAADFVEVLQVISTTWHEEIELEK